MYFHRSNPDFALETIQFLTKELRQQTKISRATKTAGKREDTTSDSLRKSYNRSDTAEVFKVLCYDTTSWVRENFEPKVEAFNQSQEFIMLKMDYTADRLDVNTASYAVGYDGVCLFVNDTANADVLQILSMGGVGVICMRCAGFDRVDLDAAKTFGLDVVRVPAYSPYAVAEVCIFPWCNAAGTCIFQILTLVDVSRFVACHCTSHVCQPQDSCCQHSCQNGELHS